jgi:hypothetical protein
MIAASRRLGLFKVVRWRLNLIMTFFPQSLQVAVQSFGVAPAVIIAFFWGIVIFGLLAILRQGIKLKRAEREWRQWRANQAPDER